MPALLAPVIAGAGIGTGIAFGTVTWATVIANAVFIAGGAVYSNQARKKMAGKLAGSAAMDPGRSVMIRSGVVARDLVYGQVKKSGPVVFVHKTGSDGEYFHIIVALASHECEEIGDIYFGDEVVPLDGSGNATGKYAGYARVKKYVGTDSQTADADLISEAPTKWTSDHRLRGIAYVYVRLKYSNDIFPTGVPNISAVVKGRKVYDPRTGLTVYSNNAALCIADYLNHAKLGLNVPYARISSAELIAAANICDESVDLNPSGTEARYAIDGVVSSDAAPKDILEAMRGALAGAIIYSGGEWYIQAGAYRTPTLSLSEAHIVGPVMTSPRLPRAEICNAVKGIHVWADESWTTVDFPPVKNATYTTQDNSERIWHDIELPFTTSSARAQRLAKIHLERTRQQITVQTTFNLTAVKCRPGDVIQLSLSRYGWTTKAFEVVAWKEVDVGTPDAPAPAVELTLRETASTVYDWSNGEETVVDAAPDTTLPDPWTIGAPSSLSVGTTTVVQSDGTIIPKLTASWTAPTDQFVKGGGNIVLEYKPNGGSTWERVGVLPGNATSWTIDAVKSGESYDVRVGSISVGGVPSTFATATATVAAADTTAPAQPTSLSAVAVPEGIEVRWVNPADKDLRGVRVYEGSTNVFGSATLVGVFSTVRAFFANITAGTTKYYWVDAIDTTGNASSPVGPVSATAAQMPNGPGVPYRGAYSGSATYYHSNVRRDIVSHAGDYWITNNTAKNGLNTWGTPGTADWTSFGATFASVATDILLAQNATILKALIMGTSGGDVGEVKSANFVADTSGWKIDANGDAYFAGTLKVGNANVFVEWNGSTMTFQTGTGTAKTVINASGITFGTATLNAKLYYDGSFPRLEMRDDANSDLTQLLPAGMNVNGVAFNDSGITSSGVITVSATRVDINPGGDARIADHDVGSGNIEIGINGSGNRNAFIDFWSEDSPGNGDYNVRIIRASGANGTFTITQTGSGAIHLNAAGGVYANGVFLG